MKKFESTINDEFRGHIGMEILQETIGGKTVHVGDFIEAEIDDFTFEGLVNQRQGTTLALINGKRLSNAHLNFFKILRIIEPFDALVEDPDKYTYRLGQAKLRVTESEPS